MRTNERILDYVIYAIIAGIVVLFFVGCQKNKDGYGDILVHAQSNGKALEQPMIYLKEGSQASTSSYDYRQSGDAAGEAYFSNLKPDTYYIYARGYDPSSKTYVSGKTIVNVKYRSRQNDYKIVVDTN